MGTEKELLGTQLDQKVGSQEPLESNIVNRLNEEILTPKETLNEARTKRSGFRLTDRDEMIFRFLMDQKFASLETLFFKFFDHRASPKEPLPHNLYVARQRLGILKRAGLIQTKRVYTEGRSLYLLTLSSWKILRARDPVATYAKPMLEVDFRNFDHDTRVNYCRVALERAGKVRGWISERRLRMHGFKIPGVDTKLPEAIIPDGIFLTLKGERIALEVEASIRMKNRFEKKIREYSYLIMEKPEPLIHRVLFVAADDVVGKDLAEVIGKREGFLLETYSHFKNNLHQDPNNPKNVSILKTERVLKTKNRNNKYESEGEKKREEELFNESENYS